MRLIDTLKLALAALAAVLFFWGIRADAEPARWAAIGCLVAAFLLRFVRPRPPLD